MAYLENPNFTAFGPLRSSRDHLSECIIYLESAITLLKGSELEKAKTVLADIKELAPRLSDLRKEAMNDIDRKNMSELIATSYRGP